MNRMRLAFSLLFVCGIYGIGFAQLEKSERAGPVVSAAASAEGMRFSATGAIVQMRVEILSPGGILLYDSEWKSGGNVLDWNAEDGSGHPLAYGSYPLVVMSKDLAGRVSERRGTLHVEADRTAIEGELAIATTAPTMMITAHDGEMGQIVTTSGDMSFRFGDFLSRKDAEKMRLTAAGNLDVHGLIRTGEGIVFPDGSIQRTAAMPSIMRMRPSNPEADKKLHPKSDIGGSGTTNQMTKWLDTIGTQGDSAVTEVGGKVGIGTTNPGGQLHIYGASNLDVFAGMGPDVISGPGFNYGYAGNSFGVGAGFFNVRPAAGATGVNPSLRFMTVDTERMIITNAGNVGIGTSTPGQKLDVAGHGNVQGSLFLAGNLALPATASATVGVITMSGSPFAHNFGDDNTFLGLGSGNFTMTGRYNTASGSGALASNTTGAANTASGFQALASNTDGELNTANGFNALKNNTTGGSNTAIGFNALNVNTTGSSNIAVGVNAGINVTTGSYNIYIGNFGAVAEATTTRIGGAQTRAFIAGIRGVTTGSANAIPVVIDFGGQLGTVSSSRRSKFDIAGMGNATAGLMRLRPVTFRYLKYGESGPLQYGLIAEEVAEVYPELVARNKDGEVETVMYQFLAPMLLNEVQMQHRRIEEQQKTIDALNATLDALRQRSVSGAGNRIILTSPNGSACSQVTIDNSGAMVLTATACP